MSTFEVTFLGTNGSCAYNSGHRRKYGSNTVCIAVAAGDEVLIIDAGSGICGLSELHDYKKDHLHLFFSHYHADHLDGLLSFPELFDPHKVFDIYGSDSEDGDDLRSILENYLSPSISPIGLDAFQARINYNTIASGDLIELPGGVTVRTFAVSHPGGYMGCRIEYGGKSFCCCTDVELSKQSDRGGLLEFMKGADLLVLDSFFEDGKVIPGWGHSSWRECATLAKEAGAKRLALIHFSPNFSDEDIDNIRQKACRVFPKTFAAADLMRTGI